MKAIINTIAALGIFSLTHAQTVISQFNWNGNNPLAAAVGPNATSCGSSAVLSTGGVSGTKGLNPGNPKTDIDMVVPNLLGLFDQANIDISIDYRRNEGTATLIKRNTFTMNQNGIATLAVVYRVNNGTMAGQTVSSGDVYNLPMDNTFRNYRFTYDNCTGYGKLYVDNVVVWTSTPTPGKNLYWMGEGDVIIGQDMDGTGNNIVNLDNFLVKTYPCGLTTLPIELVSFDGINNVDHNTLTWSTATEENNDHFTLQRSEDGMNWSDIATIPGSGNSSSLRNYQAVDNAPASAYNYYRLMQTDVNGRSDIFKTIVIDNSASQNATIVRIVDITGRDVDASYEGVKLIYYSNGKVVKKSGN